MCDQVCAIELCDRPVKAKGWCRHHYDRWVRTGDAAGVRAIRGSVLEFAQRAAKSDTTDCIIWPFAKRDHGYGQININGRPVNAHRYVLCLATSTPLSTEKHALHAPELCHSPSCVNPAHLRWGSPAENAEDRAKDGTENRGARNGQSKLTSSDVLAIFRDPRPKEAIAKSFNITPQSVSRIKRKGTWQWLLNQEEVN